MLACAEPWCWASSSVCAAVIYTGAALAWRDLAGERGRPAIVTVVGATLVVAFVISRLKPTFERTVNWLSFGERADGYELAGGFLRRLATSLELDDVLPRLAETAARTVGSRRGEVRVWLAEGGSWRQTWPLDAAASSLGVTVEVRHGGDPVGEMIVGVAATELSPSERRLLADLAGPAGVALSTVRMTHSLRRRAADIELTASQIRASRERIVDARRGEQDRIRDELSTLVRPELDAASRELTRDATLDAGALAAAAAHVSRAVDELRHLARGLYPARLAEAGLVEALRGWTELQQRRITILVAGDPGRLADPADFAAAIYFCAVTALERHGRRLLSRLRGGRGRGDTRGGSRPLCRRPAFPDCAPGCFGPGRSLWRRGRGRADRARPFWQHGRGHAYHNQTSQPRPDNAAVPRWIAAMSLRVAVGEDNLLVREGIGRLLGAEPDVEVVGLAGNREELLALIDKSRPDLVLTDIRMPPDHRDEGIQVAEQCRLHHPQTGVILLSQYVDSGYVRILLAHGTERRGYLLKERVADRDDLVAAVRKVAAGGSALDPKVVETLLQTKAVNSASELGRLTARELEVLGAMAEGQTNASIAQQLFLTTRAVEKHINSIFSKLGLSGDQSSHPRVRAVLLYLSEGPEVT